MQTPTSPSLKITSSNLGEVIRAYREMASKLEDARKLNRTLLTELRAYTSPAASHRSVSLSAASSSPNFAGATLSPLPPMAGVGVEALGSSYRSPVRSLTSARRGSLPVVPQTEVETCLPPMPSTNTFVTHTSMPPSFDRKSFERDRVTLPVMRRSLSSTPLPVFHPPWIDTHRPIQYPLSEHAEEVRTHRNSHPVCETVKMSALRLLNLNPKSVYHSQRL